MKTLEGKKVLQFNVYIGNVTDQNKIKKILADAKNSNPLNEYEDVVCIYVPVREELFHNQIVRIL